MEEEQLLMPLNLPEELKVVGNFDVAGNGTAGRGFQPYARHWTAGSSMN